MRAWELNESINPFDDTTTGMSDHTEMMNNPDYWREKKNKVFKITHMPPGRYIELAAEGFNMSTDRLISTRDVELAKKYAGKMTDGETFPMLTLDYSKDEFSQEGIHRAMAAEMIGVEKVPVIITKKDRQ